MQRLQLHLYIPILAVLMMPLVGHAQQWRVVEKKYSTHVGGGNYTTVDSITYGYDANSGRGSNYTNDTINYDSYTLNDGDELGEKRYDNDDNLLVEVVRRRVMTNVWQVQRIDTFNYQAGRLMTHKAFVLEYVAGNYQLLIKNKYQYVYDVQGRVSQKKTNNYNYGVAEPDTFYNYYAYNAKGQLVKDSVCKVSNGGAPTRYDWHYFAYNANDDTLYWERYTIDTSGNAILFSRVDYTYNAQGQLITDSLYYGSNNTFKHVKHSYTYDAQDRLIADTAREYGYMASNTVTMYTYTPFSYYSEVNSGALDSNGNITFTNRVNYQYQLYWPVGVQELAADASDITLYPNPATSVLHINTSEAYTQGRIYNSMGQMVQVVNANSQQVNVSELPAGNYYLQLTIDNKMMSKQFSVLR